ncbi:pilus assembly protein TadG-related protein [Arthrobacter sp. HY1533]|uniref:pilus assembly protein TadG-related protein n=1 Tax=Arthrobacter sp. HY1533 TaxID=2970919 RepID=UPI0022BA0BB1|nr:pilus assembly protein TadG-related protein [Arthrobacter sp. HY1533]
MRRIDFGKRGTSVPAASQNQERGAITVLTALCMVVLLVMVAMVADFGLAYAEKAQLQNGADAAAMAVAGDCGKKVGTPSACPGSGLGSAQQLIAHNLANGNSNDDESQVVLNNSAGVITATTSTISGGKHFLSLPLATLTGFDTAEIKAVAKASWGGVKSGAPILPLTFGACELDPVKHPMGPPDRLLISHGTKKSGPDKEVKCDSWNPSAGLNMPGGFGWLDATSECHPNITISDPWVDSDTGINIPKDCKDLFVPSLKGKTVLVPIFGFADGTGASGKYKILGWGVFIIQGWNFPSSTENWSFGSGVKGLYGHFTKQISFEDGFTWGGPTEYGLTQVKLIK